MSRSKRAAGGLSGRLWTPGEARPGAALRALRRKKDWTLAQLSLRTGLSISTLSKIENDRCSLTYGKLALIGGALSLDIGRLIGLPELRKNGQLQIAPAGRVIVRKGEGRAFDSKNYRRLYLASDLLNKRFVPMLVECRAKSLEEFGELLRRDGEEFAYVLNGTLIVHTYGYAAAVLRAGEAIYFDCRMGYAYLAGGSGPCRVLAVTSPSERQ